MNKATLITLILVKRKVHRDPVLKRIIKESLNRQSMITLKIEAKRLNIPINN